MIKSDLMLYYICAQSIFTCSLKAFHSFSGEQHVHCVPGHRRPDRGPYRHANQCHLHIHRGMDIRSCRLPVLDCRRLPCLHSFNFESVYPQSGSILVRHFPVEISEEENKKASYADDFNSVVCVQLMAHTHNRLALL